MLLAMSVIPAFAPHWWERDRSRLLVSSALGGPVALWLAFAAPHRLGHAVSEYASFLVVMVALYVITSHIVLTGSWVASPGRNTAVLALGAALASCIGTTGTTMLLIRPLLRSNAARPKRAHVVVFFIFLAGNLGGLLTPMGDPPLYLGLLRGVPFFWTLRLWPVWLGCCTACLAIFYFVDTVVDRRHPAAVAPPSEPVRLAGGHNLLWLASLVALVAASGMWQLPTLLCQAGLLALAGLCFASSSATLRRTNGFSWAPVREVAILFAGIFLTMAPALMLLEGSRETLLSHVDPQSPRQFFWVTGLFSSVLDNAPTYVTATATASSLLSLSPLHLQQLAADVHGEVLLAAISCGAVLMGALTYIGNGPNLLVKAVAEEAGTPMPSFLGYVGIAAVVLLPLFMAVSLLFFN